MTFQRQKQGLVDTNNFKLMNKDFTIDKISWHTQTERNYEFDTSVIYRYFEGIITFLQENNLTTRTILKKGDKVTEETCIMRSDLTDVGFQLIKKCYSRWVDAVVDKGKSPNDFKTLTNALKKITV